MPRTPGPLTLLSTSRKARWAAVVAVMPPLYVASLGPLMWLWRLPRAQILTFPLIYYLWPYTVVAEYLPSPVRRVNLKQPTFGSLTYCAIIGLALGVIYTKRLHAVEGMIFGPILGAIAGVVLEKAARFRWVSWH